MTPQQIKGLLPYLTADELQRALEWGSAVWHADPTADPTAVAEALGLL